MHKVFQAGSGPGRDSPRPGAGCALVTQAVLKKGDFRVQRF